MALEAKARKIGGSMHLVIPKNIAEMMNVRPGEVFEVTYMGTQVTYTKTGRCDEPKPREVPTDREFMEKLEKEKGVPKGTFSKGVK